MVILSNLVKSKVSPDFIDLINKLFYKQGIVMVWDKDTKYNLYKTDMKTPIASFNMFLYKIKLDSNLVDSVAFTDFTPELKYKNRTIIRGIFEQITKCSDITKTSVILSASDFIESTLKFKEDNLVSLGFRSKSILDLSGIKSNFEYIRIPA